MKVYQNFVANRSLRRIVVLLFCIILIWFMRGMMSTVLLTFIFTFLSISLIRWVQKYLRWSPFWIITPIYLIIVGLVYLLATHYIPSIVDSTVTLGKKVFHFYNSSQVQHNPNIRMLVDWLKTLKLDEQLKTGLTQVVHYVTSIGAMGVTLVISFLLSYFYSFEADRMNAFGRMFKKGRFSWFFEDVQYFAQTFVNTFGVVLEAQLIIAFINTVLTSIVLIVLNIPSVPSLAIMIFLLSMIPVAGVIVSLLPLSIVAYTVGGFRVMVYIWIAVALIHFLETYVLNPKLMSSRTHLPIFVTFIILLISEKLLGTWGLIVGIPIFTFFLDIMGIRQEKVKK